MGSKSDFLEAALLDHVLGATAYTPPANVYLALFSVTPDDTGAGTEATGSGYERLEIPNDTSNWAAATGDPTTKSNAVLLQMARATDDWSAGADMVAWALFDDSTAGNMLYWGDLVNPKPILNGDTPIFDVGNIVITED